MCEVSGVSTFRSAAITILRKMPNNKRSESQYLAYAANYRHVPIIGTLLQNK